MSKMDTLLKKQALIASQIEAEKMKARDEVVWHVREAIAEYGITLREIKNVLVLRKPRATKTTARKTTAKKTTWSGLLRRNCPQIPNPQQSYS